MIMGVNFFGVEAGEVATFLAAEVVEEAPVDVDEEPEGFLFLEELEPFSSLFEMGDIFDDDQPRKKTRACHITWSIYRHHSLLANGYF